MKDKKKPFYWRMGMFVFFFKNSSNLFRDKRQKAKEQTEREG